MKKIVGLFFTFIISNTINIDLSSNLEFQKGKIVDINKGSLVLFPSSLFHRTIPFISQEERHSIAFDLIPK